MADVGTKQGEEFREDHRRASARLLPAEVLGGFTRLDDRRSALAVLQTFAITAGLIAAAAHWWTPWVVVPCVFLIATQQHAMFVLAHDAAHYRLFSNRSLNDFVGRLLGSLTGISMCSYRIVHRLHHNHLYGPQDPDAALHGGYPRGRAYLARKIATDLAGLTAYKSYAYFFGAPALNVDTQVAQRPLDDTAPALRQAALRDRRSVVAMQVAMPIVAAALFGWAGFAQYLVLWLLPLLTVVQAILRVRAILEHGAPASLDSPLRAARTNLAGPIARLAFFPHHVNYHIEHHLFPAVPHYNLPELHAELVQRGLLESAEVRRPLDAWRRVYASRGTVADQA